MKIYVSEKEEFFKIAKDYSERDMLNISLLSNNNYTITLQEDTKIQSLEQHEAEIRKPLIDAIVELNEFISRLISEKEPETAREITERHHREIMLGRKNKFLEEEIESLKKQLDLNDKEHFKNALAQLRNADYESVKKPLEEEIERLKKENKQLIKDNKLLDKTKYTAQQDDINFFVSEERRKVIAELEEWVNTCHLVESIYEGVYCIDKDDLKEKLNEMKGY